MQRFMLDGTGKKKEGSRYFLKLLIKLTNLYIYHRGPKQVSTLWNYFQPKEEDGKKGYKCKSCTYFNAGKNFTTLKSHLARHPTEFANFNESDAKPKVQPPPSLEKFMQTTQNDPLVDFFMTTPVSMNLVESPGFVNFVHFLDPNYKLPSRRTLTLKVTTKSTKESFSLLNELRNAKTCNIVLDIWSQSSNSNSYLGIVAQYFDSHLKRVVNNAIAMLKIDQPHTAETIAIAFEKFLFDSKIDKSKILRVITDQGSNMIKAIKDVELTVKTQTDDDQILEDVATDTISEDESSDEDLAPEIDYSEAYGKFTLSHTSCAVHIFNSSLKKIFDSKNSKVKEIKKNVLKFVASHTRSVKKTEQFKSYSVKKLVKFGETRWNSFYYVIKRLSAIKEQMIKFTVENDILVPFKWSDIENLENILGEFETQTNALQGDFVTISKLINALCKIFRNLNKLIKSKNIFSQDITELKKHLEKKFAFALDPNAFCFDPMYICAAMLDPSESVNLPDKFFQIGKCQMRVFFGEYAKGFVLPQPNDDIAVTEMPTLADESSDDDEYSQRKPKVSKEENKNEVAEEINEYIKQLERGQSFNMDAISFWVQKNSILSEAALNVLSMPVTSACVERLFSYAGLYSSDRKSKIEPPLLSSRSVTSYNKYK